MSSKVRALRWFDLSPVWQACLGEAWQAFLHGSIPIGAVVTDAQGKIIARGRNHIYDDHHLPGQVSRNQLAHAELNALLNFDRDLHDHHKCAIYTSMEPCPLCMGAIYMMGIGQVHFAARDSYAGSTNLLGTTEYYSRKDIRVFGPPFAELEAVLIALMVMFDLRRPNLPFHARIHDVLAAWQATCPDGVNLGYHLGKHQHFNKLIEDDADAESGFDLLFAELESN